MQAVKTTDLITEEQRKQGVDGRVHRWRCTVCNELVVAVFPPDSCPVCGAFADNFVLDDDCGQPKTVVAIKAASAPLGAVTTAAAGAAPPGAAAAAPAAPPKPVDIEDLEQVRDIARDRLRGWCGVYKMCDGDYSRLCQGQSYGRRLGFGGMGSGQSFRNNFLALRKVSLKLRVIEPHVEPDCSYNFFGQRLAAPVMGAPATGVTSMANAITEDELCHATVFGCKQGGTLAWRGDSHTYNPFNPEKEMPCIKAITECGGFAVKISKPRELDAIKKTFELAEAAGCIAVGVDVDAPSSHLMTRHNKKVMRHDLTDLKALVGMTKLPVIFKGIMCVEDALLAVESGAAAIVVSNHGGRVLDSTPGTADVLPEIVAAVNGRVPVLVDGGVRTGFDILKMLALGASAVLIGRDILRAAIGGGAKGVELQIKQLITDLKRAMVLCGVNTLAQVDKRILANPLPVEHDS